MSSQVVIRLNGVSHAFLREFGCPCCRCSGNGPIANTSASLIILKDGRVVYHILFDCGFGVVESLRSAGLQSLSSIFCTHGHFDHVAGLNFLLEGARRHDVPTPVTIFATRPAWEMGPAHHFGYLAAGPEPRMRWHEITEPENLDAPWSVDLGLDVGLRVTAVPVWHGKVARGAVIFVVEFDSGSISGGRHKAILGWDLLHLIPRYPVEDRDAGYQPPNEFPDATTGQLTDDHRRLFQDADLLLLEGNTRFPKPSTGHTSIEAGLRFLVPAIRAQMTRFVHFSGHEDDCGPITDEQVNAWIRDQQAHGFGDLDIRVGAHGETFRFD
jgi:hypothetical protein